MSAADREVQSSILEFRANLKRQKELNQELKELRIRRRELEDLVVKFLDENGKAGLRFDNIVFMAGEKNSTGRKKRSEIIRDMGNVLRKRGIEGDIEEIVKEIEESRRGEKSTLPVLKIKAANIL